MTKKVATVKLMTRNCTFCTKPFEMPARRPRKTCSDKCYLATRSYCLPEKDFVTKGANLRRERHQYFEKNYQPNPYNLTHA